MGGAAFITRNPNPVFSFDGHDPASARLEIILGVGQLLIQTAVVW